MTVSSAHAAAAANIAPTVKQMILLIFIFDSFCERRVHVLPLVRLGLLAVSPNLFPPGEYGKAAVNLPPVAESKTERGRRRISLVDRSYLLLIIFPKLFAVRNETTVELQTPVLIKSAQRNSGII